MKFLTWGIVGAALFAVMKGYGNQIKDRKIAFNKQQRLYN